MQATIVPSGYTLERERELLTARLLQQRAGELAKASFFGRMRIRREVRALVKQQLKSQGHKGWFSATVIH